MKRKKWTWIERLWWTLKFRLSHKRYKFLDHLELH